MRFLRSVLLASSCLLSSVSAADSAAAPDDDDGSGAATATSSRVREVYTMGFEAETSVLKVPSSQPSRLLKSLMCAWEFTLDTPDNSIATLPSEDPNTQATDILGEDGRLITPIPQRRTFIIVEFFHPENMKFVGAFSRETMASFSSKHSAVDATELHHHHLIPAFIGGHVFSESMFHSILCQTYYNPHLPYILKVKSTLSFSWNHIFLIKLISNSSSQGCS